MNKKIIIAMCLVVLLVGGVLAGIILTPHDAVEEPTVTPQPFIPNTSNKDESEDNTEKPGSVTTPRPMYKPNSPFGSTAKQKDYRDLKDMDLESYDILTYIRTGFSNGFTYSETEHIIYSGACLNGMVYEGQDSIASIYVSEIEVDEFTNIQGLRKESLIKHGLNSYYEIEHEDLPFGFDYEVGIGIKDPYKYFVDGDAYTVGGGYQLIGDCTIDTKYGPAFYIAYRSLDGDLFEADCYILCDSNRIFYVRVIDETTEDILYAYILEALDSITIVR